MERHAISWLMDTNGRTINKLLRLQIADTDSKNRCLYAIRSEKVNLYGCLCLGKFPFVASERKKTTW